MCYRGDVRQISKEQHQQTLNFISLKHFNLECHYKLYVFSTLYEVTALMKVYIDKKI